MSLRDDLVRLHKESVEAAVTFMSAPIESSNEHMKRLGDAMRNAERAFMAVANKVKNDDRI